MSGDRDYLPSDRAVPPDPQGGERRFRRTASSSCAPARTITAFRPLTATLASPGSPKAEYDAAAIKLPPDPPRDPKQKNTWRWSADMSLTGEQTVLTAQLGNNVTDTLDYLAFWKTFDMAAEAAFAGKDAAALEARSEIRRHGHLERRLARAPPLGRHAEGRGPGEQAGARTAPPAELARRPRPSRRVFAR